MFLVMFMSRCLRPFIGFSLPWKTPGAGQVGEYTVDLELQ